MQYDHNFYPVLFVEEVFMIFSMYLLFYALVKNEMKSRNLFAVHGKKLFKISSVCFNQNKFAS